MARYFSTVFACIAVGGFKYRGHAFVYHFVVILDVAIVDGVGFDIADVLTKYTRKNLK